MIHSTQVVEASRQRSQRGRVNSCRDALPTEENINEFGPVMHMLATADGGLGLTPTMGQYTIQLVLSHANLAGVSTQSMEWDDRDTQNKQST